jgi:hypothetical protein
MGLLEEAIREHLELQRRRGGDARQIALAEREALEPLVPGHTPEWAQGPALFDHEEPPQPDPLPSGRPLVEPAQQPAQQFAEGFVEAVAPAPVQATALEGGARIVQDPDPHPAEAGGLDQETAELDMSAVLGLAQESAEPQLDPLAGHAGVPEFGSVRAERIVPDPAAPVADAEDFEWEIPGVTRSSGAGA